MDSNYLDDIHNLMKDNVVLIVGIMLLTIVIMAIVIINEKEYFKNEKTTSKKSNKLVLKYFGSNGCPHSRKGSRAYNIIKTFEDTYDDVIVEYYWSNDESTSNEFDKAKVEYVPTITNGNYEHIELAIPEDIDRSNKTEDELKDALLMSIYEQLN